MDFKHKLKEYHLTFIILYYNKRQSIWLHQNSHHAFLWRQESHLCCIYPKNMIFKSLYLKNYVVENWNSFKMYSIDVVKTIKQKKICSSLNSSLNALRATTPSPLFEEIFVSVDERTTSFWLIFQIFSHVFGVVLRIL